jgi:O-antigen ligase
MFAIAPLAFRTHAHRRALLATLVGIGAYLGLTAVLETTGPSALVLPHYINNPEAGLHFGRARGPFLEAQTMGLALFACGVAGCIGFYTWRTLEARLFSLAVTALCAAGVLFTLERATWLGAIGAAVVAMLAVRELRRYALPALTAGLILVIGLVAFVPGMSSKIHDRTDTTSAQRSTWDRKNLDAAAIRMTEAHPLFGVGWDRFVPDAGPYLRTSPDYPMSGGVDGHLQVVHNVFLSNAAELGLVGTFLWCIALVGALGSALLQRGDPDLRPWRIGLLANVVMWVVVSNLIPLSKPFPTLLLFTWAGLVYRPGFVRAPVPARRTLVGQSSVARPVIS